MLAFRERPDVRVFAPAGARLLGLDGAGVSLAMRIATSMLMTASYGNTVGGGTTLNLPAGYTALDNAIEEAPVLVAMAGLDPQR